MPPVLSFAGGFRIESWAVSPSVLTLALFSVAASAQGEAAPVVAAPEGAKRVLVLELDAAGVAVGEARVLNGALGQALARSTSLEVFTTQDLAAILELEADRLRAGCDTASCLAEVAGAMGARYVVFGTLGRIGSTVVAQVSMFDSEAGRPVARREVRARSAENLVEPLSIAAAQLVAPVLEEGDPLLVEAQREWEEPWTGLKTGALGAGIAGLVAGLGVTAAGGLAFALATVLLASDAAPPATKNWVARPLGIGAVLVGALAVAVAGAGAAGTGAALLLE